MEAVAMETDIYIPVPSYISELNPCSVSQQELEL